MGVRRFEQQVWMVLLPGEPQLRPELALLRKRIADADKTNLVLDLSRVEVIGSRSLGLLLRLRRVLDEKGRQLILCKARPMTKGIFRVAGLEEAFHFADSKTEALETLRQLPPPADEAPPDSNKKS
jgi:anti-anti-sigma factor